MMKPPVIVASALMIGFVSVLVYRVSASDALGLGQLPSPTGLVSATSGDTSPLKVEFIVQQCDIGLPEAVQSAALPEAVKAPPAKVSMASLAITEQWVVGAGVPKFVIEDEPVAPPSKTIVPSPSFVYLP